MALVNKKPSNENGENSAVPNGPGGEAVSAGKKFTVNARPMGLRASIDPTSFNKLPDELESDTFLRKKRRLARRQEG
jgi:hypothetical protein